MVTHISSSVAAIETLRREHDRLVQGLMAMVDAVGTVQAGYDTLNLDNLRKATAALLRRSIEARESALAVLATSEHGGSSA